MYDYLLVINPNTEISRDVKAFKQQVAGVLGMYNSRYSQAHISLFRSVFPEKYEHDFVYLLENIARKQSGFAIYTSRFDYFQHGPHKRTLYVNVANPKPLAELRKRVLQELDIKPNDFKPHITVARAISTAEFEKVYPLFENQMYVRSFNCHSFLLLRRPATGGVYERVRELVFGEEVQAAGPLFIHAA